MNTNNKEQKEITLDHLALIIAQRFDDIDEKMENGFREVNSDIQVLKANFATLKTDTEDIKSSVENIEANLNKKVDKFTHNDLEYRVEKLEKKFA